MIISNTCITSDQENPWLVLIHGFGGSKYMWKHQIEQFQDKFNIMILELPGHGDSEVGLSDYKGMQIQDVAAAIIDTLRLSRIQSADFICVSLGTLVMAEIVHQDSSIVNSVILCGAVFGMKPSSRVILKIGNVLKPFFPYMMTIRALATVLMPKKAHKVSRKFLVSECKKLGRSEFMKWYSVICSETYVLKQNFEHFKDIYSLVIMGSEDHVFLDKAKKNVTNTDEYNYLLIMEECGHVCSLQKWREFNRIADRFFKDIHAKKTATQ